MTKADLFKALTALPDDGKVLIEVIPAGGTDEPPHDGDLFDIGSAIVIGQEADERAFGVLYPNIAYERSV